MKAITKNIIGFIIGVLLMTPIVGLYKINHVQYDTYCCGGVPGHVRLIGAPLFLPGDDWGEIYWARMFKRLEPEEETGEIDWDHVKLIKNSSLISSGYSDVAKPAGKIEFLIFTSLESAALLFPVFAMILMLRRLESAKARS